ncbi:MAG: 4Fe-4S dicluster domain-containing protein [Eubacterium sp.]|nr:4Fe-4S dicluster domain-containing protein [Eubacterium sp.]
MSKIMSFTKIALKNLVSKPATTSYPFEPKEYPERTRGHVVLDDDPCILCGMCMRSCPPGAIKVDRAGGTWSINGYDCIQCGYCVEKCPKKCLSIVPGYTEPSSEKTIQTVKVEVPPPPKPAAKPAAPKPAADKAPENKE